MRKTTTKAKGRDILRERMSPEIMEGVSMSDREKLRMQSLRRNLVCLAWQARREVREMRAHDRGESFPSFVRGMMAGYRLSAGALRRALQ